MPKAKGQMEEIKDIAQALCDWFASQEISSGRACAAMGFLIGVMAAEGSDDAPDAMAKLMMIDMAMRSTAMDVIDDRRRG